MKTRFTPIHPFTGDVWPEPESTGTNLIIGGVPINGRPMGEPYTAGAWFTDLDGWDDGAESTGETNQRVLADGAWLSLAFLAARVITIEGYVEASSRQELRAAKESLWGALPWRTPAPLTVYEDGLIRYSLVRVSGKPDWEQANGDVPLAKFNVQLVSADSRRIAGTGPDDGWQELGPVFLQANAGGMRFPMRFPMRFSGTATDDLFVLPSSGGNAASDLILEFHGPVSQPGFQVNDGASMWFNVNPGAGDVLTVNLQTHEVLLNGYPKRGTVRGRWPEAKAGDLIHFTAGEYSSDAYMTARYKEAWL